MPITLRHSFLALIIPPVHSGHLNASARSTLDIIQGFGFFKYKVSSSCNCSSTGKHLERLTENSHIKIADCLWYFLSFSLALEWGSGTTGPLLMLVAFNINESPCPVVYDVTLCSSYTCALMGFDSVLSKTTQKQEVQV